jgi:DNA-binding NarL/FixJ family response regulator
MPIPPEVQPRRPITIVLARFEDLIARGLRGFVEDDGTLSLAAFDVTPEDLERALADIKPSVAILNFGSLRSPAEVHHLSTAHPATRFLILANHPTLAEANQMLAFGASACLSKETQARDILSAIHLASRGLQVLPRTVVPHPRHADVEETTPAGHPISGPELLTPREADVLAHLQEGQSNAEIAHVLHVGIETVRTHRRNIYRKLGVRTRRELASLSTQRRP